MRPDARSVKRNREILRRATGDQSAAHLSEWSANVAFHSERAMADLAAEDTEEEEQYEAGDDGEDEGGT